MVKKASDTAEYFTTKQKPPPASQETARELYKINASHQYPKGLHGDTSAGS